MIGLEKSEGEKMEGMGVGVNFSKFRSLLDKYDRGMSVFVYRSFGLKS